MKFMSMSPSSLSGSRPVPKCSSAKRKPSLRRFCANSLVCRTYCVASSSVTWKHRRFGSIFSDRSWVSSQASSALVEHRVLRDAHEDARGLAVRGEGHRGADHPAVDVLHQIIALGGGDELGRQHLVALFVEHAHQHVEHALVLAEQARDRLLHQAESILHQGALDVLDPDLVVGLHARVGVGLVDDVHLVAAELAPAPGGADRIGDRGADVGICRRQQPQTHRDRGRRVFSSKANMCSLTRLTTFSAQVSTSRAVPRSSSTSKPLPPKRPQISVAVSCARSNSASCAMKSSLAITPIASGCR